MRYLGLCLILCGVVMLNVLYLTHFTVVNILLLIPMLLILAGVVLHVYWQKKQSVY